MKKNNDNVKTRNDFRYKFVFTCSSLESIFCEGYASEQSENFFGRSKHL